MAALIGTMLVGGEPVASGEGELRSVDAATGTPLNLAFGTGGAAEVERACRLGA